MSSHLRSFLLNLMNRLPNNLVRVMLLLHTLVFGFARGNIPAALHQRPIVIKFVAPKRNELIADIGSGSGIHTAEMVVREATVVACDINLKSVEVAKAVTSAHVVVCDAQYLPFKTGCFDKVICTELLEHLDDDQRGISELFRVLKPEGIGAISVPLIGADPVRFFGGTCGEQCSNQFDKHGHKREGYEVQEITDKLIQGGFEVLSRKYAIYLPTQIALAINTWVVRHLKLALPSFVVTLVCLIDSIYPKKPFDVMLKIRKRRTEEL